jgi:hypothetical protein
MADINVGGASVGVNPQNIADSPAYKFRLDQGTQAVQRSAAGKGSLLTGGTLKDLMGYGQGLASTEYGNEWQRGFQLADLNANISSGNAGRNLSGLLGLYGGGIPSASGMAGAYGNYGAAGAAGAYGDASATNYGTSQIANTIGQYLAQRRGGGGATPGNLPGYGTPAPGLPPGNATVPGMRL